jgi:NADPH-dependent curcumin reductase CurA
MSLPQVIHQYVLKRYAQPGEGIVPEQFEWQEVPFPSELPAGSVAVKVTYISCDPTQRGWITNKPGYMPPVAIGEVMRSGAMGEVIASKNPGFAVGDLVQGVLGWRDYVVGSAIDVLNWSKLPPNTPPEFALGLCGISGLTAYFGLFSVGKLRPGETLLVSGAAGAVGQLVVQLGKISGARVIGIAGGPEKCAFVKSLGADDCIDYKKEKLGERLDQLFPRGVGAAGIDVFFDNVGAEQLDAALQHLSVGARIALCGQIANYNGSEGSKQGICNMFELINKRASIQGFLFPDYKAEFPSAVQRLVSWAQQGKLKLKADVQQGLKDAPKHANRVLTGENAGKQMFKV